MPVRMRGGEGFEVVDILNLIIIMIRREGCDSVSDEHARTHAQHS